MFLRYLFGADVFISYARSDGERYASKLASSLQALGLTCFIDQYDSLPGEYVPPRVIRALKGSSLLVLVGTPKASASRSVLQEVQVFKKTQRNIVPIDMLNGLRQGPLAEEIRGLALTTETAQALEAAEPSELVVTRIKGSARFVKQRSKVLAASLVAIVVMALASTAAVMLNSQKSDLEQTIERAVSIDEADFAQFKTPYDKKRQENSKRGSAWTGDPAYPGDLNIDDMFRREGSLRQKWGERWRQPPPLNLQTLPEDLEVIDNQKSP